MNLHEFSHVKTFKQIKVKLLFKYHDYLNIFNQAMINQLSFHCFYDHKIELIAERISSWSRLYKMFDYKLQKIKEYNNNNKFIHFCDIDWIDSWEILCYLYRVNKTFWDRKSLAVYTTASRSWNSEFWDYVSNLFALIAR